LDKGELTIIHQSMNSPNRKSDTCRKLLWRFKQTIHFTTSINGSNFTQNPPANRFVQLGKAGKVGKARCIGCVIEKLHCMIACFNFTTSPLQLNPASGVGGKSDG
jgi:hypothetical protein